jgi:ATP-dependent 26S proteasome regulatory subunit
MLSLDTSPPSRSASPRTWFTYLAAATCTGTFTAVAVFGPIHYLLAQTINTFHPFFHPAGVLNALLETTVTGIVLAVAGLGIPTLLLMAQGAVDHLFLSRENDNRDQPLGTTIIGIGITALSAATIVAAQVTPIQNTLLPSKTATLVIPNFTPIYALSLLAPVTISTIWLFTTTDGGAVEPLANEDNADATSTSSSTSTRSDTTQDSHTTSTSKTPSRSNRNQDNNDDSEPSDQFTWTTPRGPGFEKVGGYEDVKERLHTEVIDAVRDEHGAYERMDVSPPTGILLHGPPGTGKSLFGRALAEELQVPFTELSQADLSSKWVNETPELVKTLFEEATSYDSAVVFIDEIDGLLRERGNQGTAEDAKGVNEFLPRLADNESVIVIAATNRKDILDDAAIRSGRFDLKIEMGLPNESARERILAVHLEGRDHSLTSSELSEFATRLDGMSGADIEELVESAARSAASENSNHLKKHHLEEQVPGSSA